MAASKQTNDASKQTNGLQTVSDLGTEVFHTTNGSIAILRSDDENVEGFSPSTLELQNRLRSIRIQGRTKEQKLLQDTFELVVGQKRTRYVRAKRFGLSDQRGPARPSAPKPLYASTSLTMGEVLHDGEV